MPAQLNHDCAFACARTVLDLIWHLLRPEEQHEFFHEVARILMATFETRDELLAQERNPIPQPSLN